MKEKRCWGEKVFCPHVPTDSPVSFSNATLSDGTYEGSAQGYQSEITVSDVVSGGIVTEIDIVEENDIPQFFESAKEIITKIIDKQSLEVDGITGATYSSKGIQNAVFNALQNAVVSGDLKINDIQITNEKHGKHGPHGKPGMHGPKKNDKILASWRGGDSSGSKRMW